MRLALLSFLVAPLLAWAQGPADEHLLNAQAAYTAGNWSAAQALADSAIAADPTLAKAWKLDAFFQSRGVTADQINACLGNIDNISKLEQGTNAAVEKYTIQGTPTFVINGQVVEGIATWGLLRDRLRTMGAR